MASRHSSRTLRLSFLHLPSHLRIAIHQHRSFCASTSRKSTLVDLATAGPSLLMDSIHSLGIPWHTTIPLTAILVRSTFVYYISTRPAHSNRPMMNTLTPLINAYTRLEQNSDEERAEVRDMRKRGVHPYQWALHNMLVRIKYGQIGMFHYGSMFGLGIGRRLGTALTNFGVLIAITEAIRMKCGTKQGLLSLFVSPFEWAGRTLLPEFFKKVQDPAEVLAARMEKIAEAQGGDLANLSDIRPPPMTGPDTSSPLFDPTFQTEGLSWCPDLTIADSTGFLPCMVALTMAASLVLRPSRTTPTPRQATSNTIAMMSSTQTSLNNFANADLSPEAAATLAAPKPKLRPGFLGLRLTVGQHVGMVVAALFGLAVQNLPAAISLYFIPSIVVGWVQARWLDIRYPVRPGIQPCRRPLPVKKVREWT